MLEADLAGFDGFLTSEDFRCSFDECLSLEAGLQVGGCGLDGLCGGDGCLYGQQGSAVCGRERAVDRDGLPAERAEAVKIRL